MTTTDIDAWLQALQQRSKSARIYGLVYLKVILNDAKARGVILRSPADAYKIPARSERDRVLSIHEMQRLMEALHDMADRPADVIEYLLRTMRRKEEVAAMSCEEIEQETWVWTVPGERARTGERLVMDLSAAAPSQDLAVTEVLDWLAPATELLSRLPSASREEVAEILTGGTPLR